MPVWSNAATGRTWLSFVTARLPQSGKGRSAWVGCEKHLSHYPHPSRLPLIKLQLSPKFQDQRRRFEDKVLLLKKRVIIRYALSCYVVILIYILVLGRVVSCVLCLLLYVRVSVSKSAAALTGPWAATTSTWWARIRWKRTDMSHLLQTQTLLSIPFQ